MRKYAEDYRFEFVRPPKSDVLLAWWEVENQTKHISLWPQTPALCRERRNSARVKQEAEGFVRSLAKVSDASREAKKP